MSTTKTVKSGPVEIRVRKYSDGRYGFDWQESGRRKQGRWVKQADAITEAEKRVKVISGGRIDLLDVDPLELAEFRKWKAACGARSKTVREVRDELLAIKNEDTGIDPHYVSQLVGSWEKFVEVFGKRRVGDVPALEIGEWLRGLERSARTRNNIRDAVVQLFRFARKREYLPDSITAAEKVERIKIRTLAGNIDIYTPEEMQNLLKSTPQEILPWVVIGGFAGVRTEEMRPKASSRKDPLRWEDFRWDEKQIILRAETAKTDRTRYIPMSDNLAKWLAGFRKMTGPVIALSSGAFYKSVAELRNKVGIKGREKSNALRHSYGSYRNAIIRNIGTLAEEMGNSPGIARKNYERPQPRGIAEEWFAIKPQQSPARCRKGAE